MTNNKENVSFDWSYYDWGAVSDELDQKGDLIDKGNELESISRDIFIDFVRHLHDDEPEMYHIMLKIFEADKRGDTEELDKWKKLWDSYVYGKRRKC